MELKFEPETHLYQSIDEPDKKWTSVTTLIGLFKEKFDTDAVALKCSQRVPTNKKPNKWYGMLPEQIKEAWKNEQHRADSLGTWYHDQREQEVLACETLRRDDIDIPVFHPIIKNGIKMAPDQKLVEGIYPEHFMYLKSAGLCGQADRVEVIGDRVDVYDYKSNKKIEQQSHVNWEGISKKMYPPVQHLDDCVSGDTRLLTEEGIVYIKDAVNKNIKIWNGEKWCLVKPFSTGSDRQLFRIKFNDGSFLDATSNHKFLIKYRLDKDFEEQTTLDIINKMSTTKWKPRLPNSCITMFNKGIQEKNAYDYGFILGDGNVYNNVIKASIATKDKFLKFTSLLRINNYSKESIAYFNLDVTFSKKLKYQKGLPLEIFTWDKLSILQFVAGWIDADGTNQGNGIRLYGEENKLRDCQLLLTKCGIKTFLKLFQTKGTVTNLGVRKKDLWYLSIVDTITLPTQRVIANNIDTYNQRHKWQYITSIEKLDGLHDTYCLNEKNNHTCVFNNVLTKQCNLMHYTLQLSIYMYIILKHNRHLKPGKLVLQHVSFEVAGENEFGYPIHALDLAGDPIVKEVVPYELPYLKDEVESMIKYISKNPNILVDDKIV